MKKATVRDIRVNDKRVLVRVDFNVPLDKKTGAITDDTRIRATLPTIRYLVGQKARVVLISHLGRPKGKVAKELSLAIVVPRLSQLLGQQVGFASDCIGPEVEKSVANLSEGQVLLLENLRFHPEEEAGNDTFAQALARLAEIFVNDAFGASHRAHASITGIAKHLPAVAGLLLEKEVDTLGHILENPVRPFAALLGGAKVSDKVGMLQNIIGRVDSVLVGGGMAATFLKAKSLEVGLSLVEDDKLHFAANLMKDAAQRGARLLLPDDVVVAKEINSGAEVTIVSVDKVAPDFRIVDIGPKTLRLFTSELDRCKTIFWNGPMGIYEIPEFAEGTKNIVRYLANHDETIIIGGGSTAEAVTELGLADKMTFVSTGGGASLTFLSGESLPGVEVLRDKK